jgi:Gram-negative bacterial TonB protein C-terminal/NHL repeat
MMRFALNAAAVLGAVVLGGAANAQTAAEAAVPDRWSSRLQLVEQQLRESQWEAARHMSQAIFEELVENSGGTIGDKRIYADDLSGAMADSNPLAETLVLGRAAAFRAIAEASVERRDEARWHWYMAQNFLGDVSAIGLPNYRKSAQFLHRHTLMNGDREYAGMPDVLDPVRPEEAYGPKFREPQRTRVVYPYLPRDLRGRDRFSHVVFVQITVDATGQIVSPVVVDGGFYPGLTVRAFDALREWRYRPATIDGNPIPFRFIVPVAFADDRAILPLAEWSAPSPSLGILSTGLTLNRVAGFSADLQSGVVYVVDKDDSRVLRIDPRGSVTRIAGTGTPGFNGEERDALDAQLKKPSAVSYDPRTGELFIADTQNYRVRSVSPKNGRLHTVAGVGIRGVAPQLIPNDAETPEALTVGRFSGDGNLAAAAELNLPAGVCADPTGILFVADSGNHRIRAVNRGTSPVIVMGVEIAPDRIETVAGTGVQGFAGDGGKAAQAQFDFPTELRLDAAGNLLVLDSFNQRIRRIDRQSAIIRTIAQGSITGIDGTREAASWSSSLAGFGIATNQDILYADRSNRTVHRLTRAGDDRVIYTALPREGQFSDLEIGAQGEIIIGERRRIGVLRLENISALTYLDAAKPLEKRASVSSSPGR